MIFISTSELDLFRLDALSVSGISVRTDFVTTDIQPNATMSAITANMNPIPITTTQSGLRI
jgi:hypothetical protein